MSLPSVSLVSYVWHYIVARTLYDQVVRTVSRGRASDALLVVLVAALAFLAGRLTGRRR